MRPYSCRGLMLVAAILSCNGLAMAQQKLPTNDTSEASAVVPRGRLGFQLGTYLTVEGIKAERGKIGDRTLIVDTVNGQKLDKPINVPLEGVTPLPSGVRCAVRGYETGEMIGVPAEAARKEGLPIQQAAWQFFRTFIVTSVVEPKELKTEK